MENTVEVTGKVSRLSVTGSDIFMLTSRGSTVVPIAFASDVEPGLGGATLQIAVPESFDGGESEEDLFAALDALSVSSGAALTVVSARF